MWTGLIFLFLCAFAARFGPAAGICSVSKYNGTSGDTVKCSNATVDEARRAGGPVVVSITIINSQIFQLPENAFINYAKSLQALTLQNCGIRQLHLKALAGLTYLKKLNLPNNNITVVQSSWFESLISLEQLDLSFNTIIDIDPAVFARLTNLRRINLDDNQLKCLEPKAMEPMRSLAKFRVTENPLRLICRARMTLWFKDKGINYLDALDPKSGSWLDRVLWLCAEDDYVQTKTESDYIPPKTEQRMRECVLLNLFNQLRSALKTTNSYGNSAQKCVAERRIFASCIGNNGGRKEPVTNGEAMMNMILALRGVKENFHLPG